MIKRIFKILGRIFIVILVLIIFILAGFTFSSALRERQNNKQAAPQTGKFISTKNGEIFIQEMGPADGQPLVFIHGSLAWSETWKEVMMPLSEKGFRTIAIDLPPFGFSKRPEKPAYTTKDQAQRIINLADAMQIKPILVGHSFGGSPTVEAVMMAPDKFSGLILIDVAVDPNAKIEDGSNPVLATFLKTNTIRNSLISATLTNPYLTRYFLQRFIYDPSDATDEIVAIYQQPLSIYGSTNALGDWLPTLIIPETGLLNQSRISYQNLKLPTLIIWGERDTITPINLGYELKNLIPDSELTVLEETGHIPQIEDVNQLNEALITGLEKLIIK